MKTFDIWLITQVLPVLIQCFFIYFKTNKIHPSYDTQLYPSNMVYMNCIQQHKHTLIYLSNSNLNFIRFNNILSNTVLEKGVLIINYNIKWFHLCILTVYCIYYWHSLRRPDDGRDYDRNMLVTINV